MQDFLTQGSEHPSHDVWARDGQAPVRAQTLIATINVSPRAAVTTAVNAVPMTTATARSMRLPRVMNCLKPFTYLCSPWCRDCLPGTRPLPAGDNSRFGGNAGDYGLSHGTIILYPDKTGACRRLSAAARSFRGYFGFLEDALTGRSASAICGVAERME
jgi:hypothetical protein